MGRLAPSRSRSRTNVRSPGGELSRRSVHAFVQRAHARTRPENLTAHHGADPNPGRALIETHLELSQALAVLGPGETDHDNERVATLREEDPLGVHPLHDQRTERHVDQAEAASDPVAEHGNSKHDGHPPGPHAVIEDVHAHITGKSK